MRVPRTLVVLSAALLCATGVAACGSGDNGDDTGSATATQAATTEQAGGKIDSSLPPVRIPLVAIESPVVNLMDAQSAGATAAAKKINAEGGFGGREVIVEECSTELTPASTTVCANRTVDQEGLVAEIGCDPTWAAGALEIYSRKGIPSFNCLNSPAELASEWAFGVNPGSSGAYAGVAAWLCEQDDVQKVAMLGQDLPTQRDIEKQFTDPIIEACGKEMSHTFVAPDAADLTPFVNDVLKGDPDFVMIGLSPTPAQQALEAFRQAGFSAERASVQENSCNFANLDQGGEAMQGVICPTGWIPWSESDNEQVQEYIAAMEEYSPDADYRDTQVQWGYANVMLIYEAAKKIGFDTFDAETLTETIRNEQFDFPLSREWANPPVSPEFQAMKQPSIMITRWTGEALERVQEGTEDGWVNGYEAYVNASGTS
jgi:ABC-type branched-subunit amino acid transport system substrate-binding protein